MKKIIIIFYFLLSSLIGFSQNRELILIIDTIEQARIYILEGFSPSVNYGGFANFPKEIETERFSNVKFPNFISKKFQIHDTSTIYIQLSKKGDILEIKGLKKISKDTIRINKLPTIQNNLSDTTYTIKYWFLEKNDSLILLPNKTEKIINVSKKQSKEKNNSEINLIINQKKYSSSLVTEKRDGEITNGSGTKPINPYKKDGTRKKNVMRLNIHSETINWIYKGIIKL